MSRGFSVWVVRTLTWFSTACCVILLASFAVFAVNQTGAASRGQVAELTGSITPASAAAATNVAARARAQNAGTESPLHKSLDDAAETLRSPFSGLTSSSHSEWYVRGLGTLLALLFYGVILRFIARIVQLRTKAA